ncbi:MAG: peptidoglycan-associated lipoprotein Pal [Bdellovibrionales bacterium]|nr:peptidoglycan-associated lipoprotein Pal [Bdellovibrionales bacterium]
MIKKSFFALCLFALVFNISCGSKEKKAGEDGAVPGGEPDAAIASKTMNFDPEGSDSGKIQGLNTVNFDYDKSNLTTKARDLLKENANWIKDNGDVVVQIEGHCDTRGSVEYNLALGERRAKSVKNYLVSMGVDPKRMTIISYGEEKTIDDGSSDAAHARNRRANFVPLPK